MPGSVIAKPVQINARAAIDAQGNQVKVGTAGSVPAMESALDSLVGTAAPVAAYFDTSPIEGNATSARERLGGRVRGGDRISSERFEYTAGFGAWQEAKDMAGRRVDKHFLITSAHLTEMGEEFFREAKNPKTGEWEGRVLGKVRRDGTQGSGADVDASAILLHDISYAWTPREIYLGPKATQPVTGLSTPTPGMIVCTSGATTDIAPYCGFVEGPPVYFIYTNAPIAAWEVPIGLREKPGDSGAPVWQAGTGNAIGLWNAGTIPSFVTPMLPMTTGSRYEAAEPLAPGVMAKLGYTPGNLSTTP